MRGDMELHPRHFIYFAAAVFGGISVKYFINRVILDETEFFADNVSTLFFYIVLLVVNGSGIFIDVHVRNLGSETEHRKFLKKEIIVMIGFLFVMINLLAAAAARRI